jgi:catechol 2,3-dioxygenase-like lactoylglutathione lyase family enzyme
MDMRIELILLPTTDAERTKAFYRDRVGFVVDHDVEPGNGMRVIQLTPPGSTCSIGFGTGLLEPTSPPVKGIHLVVDDLDEARAMLAGNGVDVSEINDWGGGVRSAFFGDPDGNSWEVQELRL